MVSLSSDPLHPRLLFSLPSWQHSSPSPMMTRRKPGVATSTRCYPIWTDPVPSTLFTCSLVSSRCVCGGGFVLVFVFLINIYQACTDPTCTIMYVCTCNAVLFVLYPFFLQHIQRKFDSITHTSVRFLGDGLQRMGNQFLSSLEVMTSCSQCPTVLLDAETVSLRQLMASL